MTLYRSPRLRRGALSLCLLAAAGLLAACSPGGAPGATAPTAAPQASALPATVVPPATALPATVVPPATALPATVVPPATAAPQASASAQPSAVAPADDGRPRYLDDRSSPEGVLSSFYNAISRGEYARAYTYWEPDAARRELPPFAQWVQGYADTRSVTLTPGRASNDPGAGQSNYSVPVVIEAHQSSGAALIFAGCYRLHLASPAAQATPPFQPIGIVGATVQSAGAAEEAARTAAQLCGQSGPFAPSDAQSPPAAQPIDASVYIDDRSSASAVLRSFYNAINRKEYLRAYSAWEPQAAQQSLPPFERWQAGYASTQSVEIQTGAESSGAGAGNLYVSVPVGVTAHQSDGSTQRFAGCYTLHMPNPGIETEPPTHGLGIRSASLTPVEAGADLAALIPQTCP